MVCARAGPAGVMAGQLNVGTLERHLRTHAFGLAADLTIRSPRGAQRDVTSLQIEQPQIERPHIGVELEFIPVDRVSRRVARLDDEEGRSVSAVARAAALQRCWREERAASGAPMFVSPSGGQLTFEPGGQLEYSTSVCMSIPALLSEMRDAATALREAADVRDIELLTYGLDPVNGIADAPLQLGGERYRRMDAYFARIGPDGARMMRQTASLQVCLGGLAPLGRWRLLNALAPFLIAMFANSRRYAGMDTGHASHRAVTWRGVDPLRTGVFPGEDPVREYLDFALAAQAFLMGDIEQEVRPFRAWLNVATLADWNRHLSTLFPEVRPRGYMEMRSVDAVPEYAHAAVIVLLCGLTYDDRAASAALELVGAPDSNRLALAGTAGLRADCISTVARELASLACDACERLGPAFVGDRELAEAHAFFDQWTHRGRAPADASDNDVAW